MLVEDDDMIEALTAHGADEPLHIGRLPWRAWGDEYLLNAEASHTAPEPFSVDGIAVVQLVTGCRLPRESLDHLLCGPPGGRVLGDTEVNDLAPLMSEHQEHVQYAKRGGRDGEEVNRHKVLRMIVQEGPPGL